MRKRLCALALALALGVGCLAAFIAATGLESVAPQELYAAYPTVAQVKSWRFMSSEYDARTDLGESPLLVCGSSELNPALAGPAHPASLFSNGRFGMSAMVSGRAGCADLWHAIELGAYGDRLDGKRVVIFPSMQWFMCYRRPDKDFPGVFSEGAYQACMENDAIPSDLKRRICARMAEYGVKREDEADAGALGSLHELLKAPGCAVRAVDERAASLMSDVRIARELLRDEDSDDTHPRGYDRNASNAAPVTAAGEPDWEAISSRAEAEARAVSTNPYGFSDRWFKKKWDKWREGAARSWKVSDGAYFSQQEFEDFKMLLEVCRACGIEPLIVLQPVKGAAYDETIYTREVRAQYYNMMRAACAEAGVAVADFSDREYDTYFLRDYSHPSALGSACYSRAIYDFCMGAEGER